MLGISTKTIYAISALKVLNKVKSNDVLKIKDISLQAKIPQNFLEQILLELKKNGLLISVKGAYGGYKLAKPLKDITLKDVVMVLETDIFSPLHQVEDYGLKLFWEDLKNRVEKEFDISLTTLEEFDLQANKVLNYSI